MTVRNALCVLVTSLAGCGCSFGPSASEKAEAGQISRAIDVLRAAPNPQKAELLGALQQASCENGDLCELKRVCVAGFAGHVSALSQTARAKSLLASGQADAEAAQALSLASAALAGSAPKLARCADAQGAAHRKYKF